MIYQISLLRYDIFVHPRSPNPTGFETFDAFDGARIPWVRWRDQRGGHISNLMDTQVQLPDFGVKIQRGVSIEMCDFFFDFPTFDM